jgi:hypothetical protein
LFKDQSLILLSKIIPILKSKFSQLNKEQLGLIIATKYNILKMIILPLKKRLLYFLELFVSFVVVWNINSYIGGKNKEIKNKIFISMGEIIKLVCFII